MSSNKICLNCGSSDLVSDRSLGGKMVCFKCGSSSFKNKSFLPIQNKKIIYFVIALLIYFFLKEILNIYKVYLYFLQL